MIIIIIIIIIIIFASMQVTTYRLKKIQGK
jgi:hypothetical protein